MKPVRAVSYRDCNSTSTVTCGSMRLEYKYLIVSARYVQFGLITLKV